MAVHELPASLVPPEGRVAAVPVGDRVVALTAAGGRVHAFDDACPHQGCSLARGEVRGQVVRCFCHGGWFDLDTGAVVKGPPRHGLVLHPVEQAGDVLRLTLPEA